MHRTFALAALAAALAGCGPEQPAPPPENPVLQRTDAARAAAQDAERAIQESARRMEAEAAAAADTAPRP